LTSQDVVCGAPLVIAIAEWGNIHRIEQTARRNERVSILGVWQPGESFEYALACGSFNSQTYIKVMDWLVQQAFQTLKATGRMTVIVQDNGSLHTSHLTRHQWQSWRSQGLFLFFLPPYSSEMNRIEEQWHQLKIHEIVGRMFEDKYDLALAIIDGMEARSVKGGYTLERFKFNST